jgi:streptogrisin C
MSTKRTLVLGVLSAVLIVGYTGPVAVANPPPGPASMRVADGDELPDDRGTTDKTAVAWVMDNDGVSRDEAVRRLSIQELQGALADRLARELGERAAGSYIDRASATLVVNVLDERAAEQVRAAGARPALVRHSSVELERVRDRLMTAARDGSGRVDSSYVDVETNTVVVTVLPGADDPATTRYLDLVRAEGTIAEVRPSTGPGGQASVIIYGGRRMVASGGCSAGFLVKDASWNVLMTTAAHCVWLQPDVYVQSVAVGNHFGQRGYTNGDYDEGVVWNWYPSFWIQKPQVLRWNGMVRTVTGSSQAPKNAVVCKSGITTGWSCGTVLNFNVWKWEFYPDNVWRQVFGLTEFSACVLPGDSGGPVMWGGHAQGTISWSNFIVNSNGSTQCSATPRALFQPIAATLWRSGLQLVVG